MRSLAQVPHAFFPSAVNWHSPQAEGLLALWPCCEGSGRSLTNLTGSTGYSTFTNSSGSIGWVEDPVFGPVLKLTGSGARAAILGDVSAEDTYPQFALQGDLTISCWAQVTVASGYQAILSFGGNDETQAENYQYILATSGTHFDVFHENGSGTNTEKTSTATVTANIWSHCVITRDSAAKTYQFIVNGVSETAQSYTNNPDGGTHCALIIGNDVNVESFAGRLFDIRLYNCKKTVEQARQIYYERGDLYAPLAFNRTEGPVSASLAAAFRRTLSQLGTRAGGRQIVR